MEKNLLGLAKFIILQPTLEQGGYSVSPEIEDLSLPTTLSSLFFSSFNATVKTVSVCYSCTTSRTFSLPSSFIFDFFPLLIQGVCLSCGVSGISERIMTAIVPGGSPRELPRTWVSLGWLTACQLLWPKDTAWGTQISRQTTHLHRYELRLHCLSWPAYRSPLLKPKLSGTL